MYDLTLIKQNGGVYIDSREVAIAIGKRHNDLLRDIRGYARYMGCGGVRKIARSGQSIFGFTSPSACQLYFAAPRAKQRNW